MDDKNVNFLKPFNFSDFITLQKNALLTLSDSGTISEESSILRVPAINLREAFERQEAMSSGNVFLTGLDIDLIMNLINNFASNEKDYIAETHPEYDQDAISRKIFSIITSYTNIINRESYKKY